MRFGFEIKRYTNNHRRIILPLTFRCNIEAPSTKLVTFCKSLKHCRGRFLIDLERCSIIFLLRLLILRLLTVLRLLTISLLIVSLLTILRLLTISLLIVSLLTISLLTLSLLIISLLTISLLIIICERFVFCVTYSSDN